MVEVSKVFLLPGEISVSKKPHEISTILGSCISVILYNKRHKFGGMNHYMLPTMTSNSTNTGGKYGDYAIETLLKMMLAADPIKSNIDAMVFGGGHVVGHLSSGAGVAEKNIAKAFELLKQHGIRIIKKDIGGNNGRKVLYKSWDNSVEIRKIERSEYTVEAEKKANHFKKNKIKVLIVDDSKLIRDLLAQPLKAAPNVEVVGMAADPYEARELILETDPDVVTLDIIMPKMDGIAFLKKLMVYKPIPVIIISTIAQEGSTQRKRADEIGAFDIIDKQNLSLYNDPKKVSNILIPKIEAASKVVIRKKHIDEIKHI